MLKGDQSRTAFLVLLALSLCGLLLTAAVACGSSSLSSTSTTASTVSEPSTTVSSIAVTSSSLPVIEASAEPKLEYLPPDWVYENSDAVVLGEVIDVLPLRRNPLAGQPESDPGKEHLPIIYKGYVISVEKAYGPATIPATITVYAEGTGIFTENGKQYEMKNELALDLNKGDRVFIALIKQAKWGTPELKEDDYWPMASWATFRVDANGNAARITGQDLADDQKIANEFSLSTLENTAVSKGKNPSAVQ